MAFFFKFLNPSFSYRFPPLHPHWWSRSLHWLSKIQTFPQIISSEIGGPKVKSNWFWESWTRPKIRKSWRLWLFGFSQSEIERDQSKMKQNNSTELLGHSKFTVKMSHPPDPKSGLFVDFSRLSIGFPNSNTEEQTIRIDFFGVGTSNRCFARITDTIACNSVENSGKSWKTPDLGSGESVGPFVPETHI